MTSKLDDLYGDIYGDEDLIDAELTPPPETESPAPVTTSVKPEPPHNLPAKPTATPANAGTSGSLSYSAQIAQQFQTSYKQTPSQERQHQQQNTTSSAIPTSMEQPHTSPIPTHGTQTYISGDTVFGKKPSEMHDSGKIFIGGLNWETTDESLRNYFAQFGKVDACTIMRDPSGTSRGFAFMTFEDASAVAQVIGREHTLDGKSIDPKRAIPRDEHLRNTRYFVGGLSPQTTSESMKAFFGSYGKVVDATVMVDRETGRGKGFGFVTFEDAANADALVGKLGLQIDDKEIEVKMAQPRSQRDRERLATANNGGGRSETSSPQNNAIATFTSQPPQQQQMPMMFPRQNNMMGMGGGMNGMNPMGGMGIGMGNGMNGMGAMGMNGMNGMGGMGMGMNPMMMGMNPMGMMGMGMGMGMMNGGMNNMNPAMGAMRMGMGPMAMGGQGMGNGMGMALVCEILDLVLAGPIYHVHDAVLDGLRTVQITFYHEQSAADFLTDATKQPITVFDEELVFSWTMGPRPPPYHPVLSRTLQATFKDGGMTADVLAKGMTPLGTIDRLHFAKGPPDKAWISFLNAETTNWDAGV
ncbi:HnRNP A1-gamma isoform [Mycena kentingensis (nom. inval.)]|nr:HnRNP A1-gamma isoform [Mycena kentingensis (nom. inval.)]